MKPRRPREKPGAPRYSEAWRERVSRGVRRALERRRQAEQVTPSDLAMLERPGASVRPELRPLLEAARAEAESLLDALGPDPSPQRRILVEDLVRVGLALRGQAIRYAQTGEPEAASRVGSLAAVRRASLQALGLDRVAQQVPDLRTYLEQREARDAEPIRAPADADAQPEAKPASPRREHEASASDGSSPGGGA